MRSPFKSWIVLLNDLTRQSGCLAKRRPHARELVACLDVIEVDADATFSCLRRSLLLTELLLAVVNSLLLKYAVGL